VTGYLRTIRLPLSLAERVARQQDNASWPPALAFETFEAKFERVAGSLLRDDTLAPAGERRGTKVLKLKEARTLKAAAQVEKEQAHDEQRKREGSIARQRQQVNRTARDRKDEIKSKAAQDKQTAEVTAEKRLSAVRAQEEAHEKVIDRRERATKAEVLRAESEALDLTDEALKAEEKVDLIDSSIKATKEAPKTS
jgi:hypothetical protein